MEPAVEDWLSADFAQWTSFHQHNMPPAAFEISGLNPGVTVSQNMHGKGVVIWRAGESISEMDLESLVKPHLQVKEFGKAASGEFGKAAFGKSPTKQWKGGAARMAAKRLRNHLLAIAHE
jgi:hypothetical protein